MANVLKVNGFSPVSSLTGLSIAGQGRLYAIPTTDTTNSYAIGDVVSSAGGCDANGVPYVKKVANGTGSTTGIPLGIVTGVRVADPGVSLQASNLDLTTTYILAGTRTAVRYVYVQDDPTLLFVGWIGSGGLVLADAAKNFAIGSYYSGADQTYAINQSTYISAASPYSTNVLVSPNTTNTLPIRGLGLYQSPDNSATTVTANGVGARILCRWNIHEFGIGTGTGFTSL